MLLDMCNNKNNFNKKISVQQGNNWKFYCRFDNRNLCHFAAEKKFIWLQYFSSFVNNQTDKNGQSFIKISLNFKYYFVACEVQKSWFQTYKLWGKDTGFLEIWSSYSKINSPWLIFLQHKSSENDCKKILIWKVLQNSKTFQTDTNDWESSATLIYVVYSTQTLCAAICSTLLCHRIKMVPTADKCLLQTELFSDTCCSIAQVPKFVINYYYGLNKD